MVLSTKEQNESLFVTFGRLKAALRNMGCVSPRVDALIGKLDEDLKVAKVEEKYFQK